MIFVQEQSSAAPPRTNGIHGTIKLAFEEDKKDRNVPFWPSGGPDRDDVFRYIKLFGESFFRTFLAHYNCRW